MKFFVAFAFAFLVGALALTDEQKAKLKAYKESCVTETGVDPVVVENAKNGNIVEGDEKLACFAACIMKKIGVLSPEGNIDEEVLRSKVPDDIPKEQVDEVFEKCKSVDGASVCEKGGKLMKCFLENKKFTVLN
ncbi:hypothetical protein KPH14_008145 [Odynerus spinipes]|uniref:Uncharacterized protein n=1 Tax=Odynerus spinipes TaxID=1348599 RepID=A0AAD9VHX4_9HYME|nr:hypothetical protein KPH14_008145 [Odynerus spinipes]